MKTQQQQRTSPLVVTNGRSGNSISNKGKVRAEPFSDEKVGDDSSSIHVLSGRISERFFPFCSSNEASLLCGKTAFINMG